jgi:hypothetical protein
MEHQFQPDSKHAWKCSICKKEKKTHPSALYPPDSSSQSPSVALVGQQEITNLQALEQKRQQQALEEQKRQQQALEEQKRQQQKATSQFSWDNGDVYSGQLHPQLLIPHDRNGLWVCHNGCRYEGEFIQGSFDGLGRYTDVDGTIHHGFWKDDFPLGQCVRYLPDGRRLEGNVKWLSSDRPEKDGAHRMWIEFNCQSDASSSFDEAWYEGRRHSIPPPVNAKQMTTSADSDFHLTSLRNEILELREELSNSLERSRRLEKQIQVCMRLH